MRANKRTVWFLTLLSLVAVISIYYVTQKSPMPFDGIQIFDNKNENIILKEKAEDGTAQTPVFAESYLLENMRMEVINERSQISEQLTSKINSADYTAVEKDAAYEEMAQLTKRNSAEAMLEMQIKALGYPDAFVRAEDGKVKVTVLSDDGQSKKQASEITYLVMSTWEDARKVEVDFKEGS